MLKYTMGDLYARAVLVAPTRFPTSFIRRIEVSVSAGVSFLWGTSEVQMVSSLDYGARQRFISTVSTSSSFAALTGSYYLSPNVSIFAEGNTLFSQSMQFPEQSLNHDFFKSLVVRKFGSFIVSREGVRFQVGLRGHF